MEQFLKGGWDLKVGRSEIAMQTDYFSKWFQISNQFEFTSGLM